MDFHRLKNSSLILKTVSLFGFNNIVTYRVVRVTKMTGSSSDDWIY
jgi:hypothetical protein